MQFYLGKGSSYLGLGFNENKTCYSPLSIELNNHIVGWKEHLTPLWNQHFIVLQAMHINPHSISLLMHPKSCTASYLVYHTILIIHNYSRLKRHPRWCLNFTITNQSISVVSTKFRGTSSLPCSNHGTAVASSAITRRVVFTMRPFSRFLSCWKKRRQSCGNWRKTLGVKLGGNGNVGV